MLSISKISAFLGGLELPATKEQLVAYAKGRGAPQDVLFALDEMQSGKFYTIAGVWDAIPK